MYVTIKGKIKGVVALKDIPKYTQIDDYKGVNKTNKQALYIAQKIHRQNKKLTGSEYMLENQTLLDTNGESMILVPVWQSGKNAGEINPKYDSIAARVNETFPGEHMNSVLAANYDKETLTLLTVEPIKAGEQLTICYGSIFDRHYYDEKKKKIIEYTTPCTTRLANKYYYYIYKGNLIKTMKVPSARSKPNIVHKYRKAPDILYTWDKHVGNWQEHCL
jgi:hypothetical protein